MIVFIAFVPGELRVKDGILPFDALELQRSRIIQDLLHIDHGTAHGLTSSLAFLVSRISSSSLRDNFESC
jgi:hypothetical protein